MDKWINFYQPFFENHQKACQFVERIENLSPKDEKFQAKIMMHHAQRLVSLSDDLPKIRARRESLQLFFLLVCAEHISKLHSNYKKEGQSRAHTRRFFEELVPSANRAKLKNGFSHLDLRPLNLREIVDLLYNVRCDVVHEGNYWDFHFYDGKNSEVNTSPDVIVYITIKQFRNIVVRGCIEAIKTYNYRSDIPLNEDRR